MISKCHDAFLFFWVIFQIDEELVTNSGKFLILDRMLPELKKRSHKVLFLIVIFKKCLVYFLLVYITKCV